MSSNSIRRKDLNDGSSLLVSGFDDNDALASVEKQLRRSVNTPTPSGRSNGKGGIASRATNSSTAFGIKGLRTIGLQSHELGDAIRTRRDELFRNEFPLLKPRFSFKCEACESEFDEDVDDECPACGSDQLRQPDPAEKREAVRFFESVNSEGQSLRDLAKYCEVDQWVAGPSMIVIQYDYIIAQNSAMYEDGEIIAQEPDELVYGDPNTIKPVVDEDNRIGGHWWTCPVHREKPAEEPGRCEECNAELQEVYFAEKQKSGSDNYYFRDEIVTWAHAMPRLHGLDGLAPAGGVMLRQVILEMMNRYGAAFYDQESDRLPNQLMILHTTNADHWQDEMERIRDEDDPYDSPILSNEYSPQDSSTPEVQVIDAMPDQLLGQSSEIKQDFKQDIRQAIGISDVHDSDLQDAGGLNNEGLQLEVTDRDIASQQHDYVEGWLDTLAKRLGIDDWRIEFVPSTEDDKGPLDLQRTLRAGQLAAESGLDARIEDGDLVIDNGDFEAPPETSMDGQPADDEPDNSDGSAGPDLPSPPGQQASSPQLGSLAKQADDVLFDAHRHIVWADEGDVEQQAEPFFDADENVPEFVIELIQEAIDNGAISNSFESLSAGARGRLAALLEENLTQPQGWSLRSVSEDLQDEFGLTENEANDLARNEVKAINDQAREVAYEQQDLEDEPVFKWLGPEDDRKHEACWWLLEKTNPEHGGTPRPLDELRDLVQEANDRFVDGHDARRYSPHIGCRDTYVQDYNT